MEAKSVFEDGKLGFEVITVEKGKDASMPSKPLLIVSPAEGGKYPVIVFLHGFLLHNDYYTQLLQHIASHGFIVVAPQLYTLILPCSQEDITGAAETTNWLSGGHLQSVLPKGIEPDLTKLVLAGHSRGGHAAFSLALGRSQIQTTLKFSALIGVDPVAGFSKSHQVPPRILTYKPSSFNLGGMPVLVIGTGLGDQKKSLLSLPLPACAPKGVSHNEFYNECQPPCYQFVVSDYGHLDMLDDNTPKILTCTCKNRTNCRDLMRRSIAGTVTAFLKAYLEDQKGYLEGILADPQTAPAKLDPISYREN